MVWALLAKTRRLTLAATAAFEQIGGGEDIVGEQFVEGGAGVGNARQVHNHVDAVEQCGEGRFVTQVGLHEAMAVEGEARCDAVGEGKAVAIFRRFEKCLADPAAGAGEQYVESFHRVILSCDRRGQRPGNLGAG